MERRRFLSALAGAALLRARSSLAASACAARVTVDAEDQGLPVASDFIGLSYESALIPAKDYFSPDNHSLIGLVRGLGTDGVLRIGGNTSERTVFRREAAPPAADHHVIEPADLDRLAATLRELGWRLIYGLNLARGTPEEAAAEAAYVMQVVDPGLLAFQIGNEPDGFGRWSGARPSSYGFRQFMAEWRWFHQAIRARLPQAPFAGPDVAAETDWVAPFAQAAADGVVLLTRHYYADGPAPDPKVTLPRLMRSAGQIERILATLERVSGRFRVPYRIVETNSVFQGGRPGVSDTVGAALWALELMFQVAAAGGAGINFHGGDDKVYTPIAGSGSAPHRAQPVYYGMLLFAQACRGVLLPTLLIPAQDQDTIAALAAFAARERDTVRVTLINKNATRDLCIEIDPGARFREASVMRLLGPSLDASAGVTLGGASVDAFGAWAPSRLEPLQLENGVLALDIPAASAAVVTCSR
jgi:hypothetical protein